MKRLVVVVAVLALIVGAGVVINEVVHEDQVPITIVHWSNSHLMREGLLPQMAAQFNARHHKTSSGQPIQVVVVSCDSAAQVDDLASRVKGAGAAEAGCRSEDAPAPDPTIVTPQSGDWFIDLNEAAGRQVVDRQTVSALAETWLGVVTYRKMAECLGWPQAAIGYEDVLALRADPEGWKAHLPCAQAEWGRRPLLAYTNPSTSTSGRNVLVSLYSIAAKKAPADLTVADLEQPAVVQYVKDFQGLVDHYLPGTIPLNTKIGQGPKYGHFFVMPEDNLMSLCEGDEKAINAAGTPESLAPVKDLVMIYPKEGSVLNSNPAGVVDAAWVTEAHKRAAREWIQFLLGHDRQERFMQAGFRPAAGSGVAIDQRRFEDCGLRAPAPTAVIEPGDLAPDVLARIVGSWGAVKKPAIVTFVVDVSGSMAGDPLNQVKEGLTHLLDTMVAAGGADSRVGLVAFSDHITLESAPRPLGEAKYDIAEQVGSMAADGGTALFDAVDRAVRLTDDADGDPRASRAVVVLSDGAANTGRCLDQVISMRLQREEAAASLCLVSGDPRSTSDGRVEIGNVVGDDLVVPHQHRVQVFFLGFGAADIDVGRLLAQATGAEYRGSTQEDLAKVIEELSGYF